MSTYAELFTYLSADVALSALVSDRIYPATIPQGAAFPCVRLVRRDSGGFVDFDGQGDTLQTELEVDCVADTVGDALNIAAAVRAALRNYTGLLDQRRVVRATLELETDQFEPDLPGGKHRASQAWTLWHY